MIDPWTKSEYEQHLKWWGLPHLIGTQRENELYQQHIDAVRIANTLEDTEGVNPLPNKG